MCLWNQADAAPSSRKLVSVVNRPRFSCYSQLPTGAYWDPLGPTGAYRSLMEPAGVCCGLSKYMVTCF